MKDYVDWYDLTGKKYDSIKDFPKDCYGFIYKVFFTDGTFYIGKKVLYNYKTLPMTKNGKPRADHLSFIYKNINHRRVQYEIIKKESNWKQYKGSSSECKIRTPSIRQILAFAYNKIQLTYLETKYLFKYDVLEDDMYLNYNILGKFYKGICREHYDREV